MDHAYHHNQMQEQDALRHHHGGGGDEHVSAAATGIYAPQYQYSYEPIPPPMPHQQYMQHQHQHQHQQQHPGEPLPHLQVTYASPTSSKLRTRRRSAHERPSILDVKLDEPHMDGRASPGEIPPPKSHLRARNADDEEARKARKREMGRERQRRKRLRDKQKRDAAKTGGYECTTEPLDLVRAGSRSSIISNSSYDGMPSSASSTYSSLPPMSMNIAPSNAYAHGGSMSDASSPAQSLSPTMGGFASDDSSWQEHTAVFGNLNLSGDNTVRAKPRATSANLSSIGPSRRQSEASEYYAFGMTGPSPAKRRKSDTEDAERPAQVGLGVIIGPDSGEEQWDQRPRPPRRTASVPEGVNNLDPNNMSASDRSVTPPPVTELQQGFVPTPAPNRPTADGMFFASTVVLALSDNEWAASLHQKLGMTKGDLERMSSELATTFDRWKITRGMSQVNLGGIQTSPPRSSPPQRQSTFNTPSSRLSHDVTGDSPSTASNASVSSLPPNIRMVGGRPPETPHSKVTSSSSTTSPAHPSLQTPGSAHASSVFQSHDYNHQQTWSTGTAPQLSRMYDVDWRGPMPSHALSSPITGDAKTAPPGGIGVHIPPPPTHAPPHAPAPALQSPVPVQPQYIASEYQARMQLGQGVQRGYPAPGSVPIYYNAQFQQLPGQEL